MYEQMMKDTFFLSRTCKPTTEAQGSKGTQVWGGELKNILGRYATKFSKAESPELIFWLKTGVSGTNFP